MNDPRIEWRVTEQSVKQELVSVDKRWRISRTRKGNGPSEFYLSNFDMLLTPHGTGVDYKECFESFIADCDAFTERIKAVKAAAQEHLRALQMAGEERVRNEN